MKKHQITCALLLGTMLLSTSACSGGGGGDDGGSQGGGGSNTGASTWEANAAVTKDGCKERISPVRQTFTFNGDTVNTGIITVPVTETPTGFQFGYSEANGNCSRSYLAEFTNVSNGTASVLLTSTATCDGNLCENQWTGTATQTQ